MKKKIIFSLIAIVVLVIAIGVIRPKKEEVVNRIRIGYNTESITNVSIMVAYEKKFFENYGLSPVMVPLKGGKEVRQAMIANQVDVGVGGFTNFMEAMALGAPIRFIAASAASPTYVFVRPDDNINSLNDLYGKNICAGFAGVNDLIFRSAMRAENIDTNKMNFAEIERSYQVAALMSNKAVDAVVVSDQDTAMLLNAGAVLLPEWVSKGYSRLAVPRNSVAVNLDFLNNNEDLIEKFLSALVDSHRLIAGQPDEAAQILSEHIKKGSGGAVIHSPEVVVAKWKNGDTVNVIWLDPEMTLELAKTAKEIGMVDKEMTVSDIFDLRFEDMLKKMQYEIYGS